ncbi:MAG: 3-dehydroquinate synthase [Saprospiraceae bacterium]
MEKITLQTYSIFQGDCREALEEILAGTNYASIFILCDENTYACCFPLIKVLKALRDARPIVITPGEIHKNLDTCRQIWEALIKGRAERNSLLINLGGGVIGDMGGFCAATFKRGMPFIQIPTTLLAQVDASIGGKLGIDFGQVKNSIGIFSNPMAVVVDPQFLNTLSRRELRSGFAEIIKHALIADAGQWAAIKHLTSLDNLDWMAYIRPSLEIKRRVVEADPLEHGPRKSLNFGHTIGHAIEGHLLQGNAPLLHGEAIAAGMICESFLSWKAGLLSMEDRDGISEFLRAVYAPQPLRDTDFEAFLRLTRNDKKNEGGNINFSLIGPPGSAHIDQYPDKDAILESLAWYNKLVSKRSGA